MLQYGVILFVDPRDETVIHAALPLRKVTEPLISQNVDEARRVLKEFLAVHPGLMPYLRGRPLVVRMISSYEDVQDEVCGRVTTVWDTEFGG